MNENSPLKPCVRLYGFLKAFLCFTTKGCPEGIDILKGLQAKPIFRLANRDDHVTGLFADYNHELSFFPTASNFDPTCMRSNQNVNFKLTMTRVLVLMVFCGRRNNHILDPLLPTCKQCAQQTRHP